jgi:hypothetical protein
MGFGTKGKKESHKFTGFGIKPMGFGTKVTNYKNFAGPEGRCFKISHNSLKHDASRDKNG